jgi:hypothetical protein
MAMHGGTVEKILLLMNKNNNEYLKEYKKLFNQTLSHGLKFAALEKKYGLDFAKKLFDYIEENTNKGISFFEPIYPDPYDGNDKAYEQELKDAGLPFHIAKEGRVNPDPHNRGKSVILTHRLQFKSLH